MPVVTEIEPENTHPEKAQQIWNKPFEESFILTTFNTTCANFSTAKQKSVHHHFPRLRNYTEDEFKLMLRGYGTGF